MKSKVLVFDLDDTLFPERDFVYSGFRAVAQYMAQQHDIADFDKRAIALFEGGERQRVFNRCLDGLGIDADAAYIEELIHLYRNHKPNIQLPAESAHVLSALRGCKRLAIITDGYLQTQRNKIQALALDRYVEYIVYTDELGRAHWKPSATGYRQVQHFFQVEGRHCLYVADNPHKDFVTARRLSWMTVRLRCEGREHAAREPERGYEADVEIGALNEILLLPEVL
ncbi:MAG: HAD family hydrolase [Caldilineaceae bacterium]